MSKLKSSENILQLMPHVVEDYYRLQRLGIVEGSEWGKELCKPSPYGLKCKGGCFKRKIQFEITPTEAATQNGNDDPKATKRKKFKIIKSWQYPAEPATSCGCGQADKLLIERRKNYAKNLLTEMKRQKEGSQKEITFNRLSVPKLKAVQPIKSSWALTKSLKNFEPTERLLQLSQPCRTKALKPEETLSEILIVKKSALKYVASPRIRELAQPKWAYEKAGRQNPFKVSSKALKAKFSANLGFLALPRNRIDHLVRKNAFKVKRRALKARATEAIKNLAKPKNRQSS